jgi:hypothetical protein
MCRLVLPSLLVLAGAAAALALGGGRIYRNEAMRVRSFEIPRGWESSPQIAYPRILVLASGPEGARITLGAQKTNGAGVVQLAADARAALLKQKLGDPRVTPESDDRVRLESSLAGGATLRQLYLVDGDLAYVVTLFAPAARQARAVKDFEDAVRSLSIAPLVAPPDLAPVPDAGADR